MHEVNQAVERYNVGLSSADELDRDVSYANMASDIHTYAVSYDAHGHAVAIVDGRRITN